LAIKEQARAGEIVDQRLVKALAHPLRVQVLAILNERVASPNELSRQLGEGLSQVSYHVKVLRDYDCIELVRTVPRRGAVEHFYRGIRRAFLTNRDWTELPEGLKGGVSATVLETFMEKAVRALEAGTLDARDDSYLSWTPVVLDEEGWSEIAEIMEETLDRIFSAQAKSAARMVESKEEGFAATVAVASFESPAAR
jgi:DNA-binding transcriptional ArsR family regulator